MARLKLATVWLAGCSGCHMSLLDLDEFLIDLAGRVDLVYSPLADRKDYPEGVDLVLVEGAVANTENLDLLRSVRSRSRFLVALGDCAVTGNVTALRNPIGDALPILDRSYLHSGDLNPANPAGQEPMPTLLDRVVPIHAVVSVDLYLPGCPPPAIRIRTVLEALLEGEKPMMVGTGMIRFG